MDDNTNEIRDDLKLPEGDLGKEIQTKFENDDQQLCTVLKAMGEEAVIGTKAMTKQTDMQLFAINVLDSKTDHSDKALEKTNIIALLLFLILLTLKLIHNKFSSKFRQ